MKWIDKHIEVDPPKRPKKLTGTRFATVLGLNPWSTPFEAWCAITRTYEEPFEDTIYTLAGKAIEPKQAEYMKTAYGMDNLVTPADMFGKDYFKSTRGDFFPEQPVMGGMWDYILKDDDGNCEAVLEMKTTKRAEDWQDDVPEYYALQAALYAYLLGTDDVIMVASILEGPDYDHPGDFVPSSKNTITVPFKVSERYPNFQVYIDKALTWWEKYVLTGISPDYDSKKDAEILEALKTHNLSPDTDINVLVKEGEALKHEIDVVLASVSDKEKRLKEIKDMLRDAAVQNFRDGDKKVEIHGDLYTWTVTKADTEKVDKKGLIAAGLYDQYVTKESAYRLTVK